jgi:hypothetical protein
MSKSGNFWMAKYESVQDISIFPEFKREMENLGFDLDAIFEHWDIAEESRKEKEAPCASEKT